METIRSTNVVIGAGAMGSAAAYHLARRGEPFVLIEQFELGHSRGSSHGAARITRHSYADPRYARLMPAAFRAWRELEADASESLYIRTGGVSFSPEGVDYASRVAASLEELGVPHWRGTGREFRGRHPAFSLPDRDEVVFEPDAGLIAASRALAVQVELARWHGGAGATVLDRTPVRSLDLAGNHPVAVTDSARIVADRLIVTAGAWVKRLLPDLPVPVRITRQQVLYFRPADPAPFQVGRFPVFIYKGARDDDAFYGMPDFLGLGVKAARHAGPEVDPDLHDPSIAEEYASTVRQFLRGHIPALADAAIGCTEVCLYTVAPDDEFLVDVLPTRPDVIVASPCSGHGFKFSCLIGRVLADLATTGHSEIPIDPWRIKPPPAVLSPAGT
jgi:sarcosine oxidase